MTSAERVPEQERMSLGDFVKAAILLKPGTKNFKEEALDYSLRKISETDKWFKDLFRLRGDGTSPQPNTTLENIISFMQIGRILQYTGDYQYMNMTDFSRGAVERDLRGKYGNKILEKLKPLVTEVWKCASEYR